MTRYLTVGDVVTIQIDLINRYGGSHGLRDAALLEAALFLPQTEYHSDLISQAAALWESLSQNHAFVDGNKRVGFAVTYTFLMLNGLEITAEADETFAFIDGLYRDNAFSALRLDAWLRGNVADRAPRG